MKKIVEKVKSNARKDKISPSALKKGAKIEKEHTKVNKVARKIAKDHLEEHPMYYDNKKGLPAMEKKLTKIEKPKSKK